MNARIEFEPAHPVSDSEIAELSRRNPALRFERTPQGALIVAPPTGFNSSIRNNEISRQLNVWNERKRNGYVADSSGGFSLSTGALYAPDASWTAKERLQTVGAKEREGFAPLCPDAVFELRSKSDTPIKLLRKIRDYIDAGAKLAVLIDPYQKTVTILFPGEEPRTHENPSRLTFTSHAGIEPLPGFELDLQRIFNIG